MSYKTRGHCVICRTKRYTDKLVKVNHEWLCKYDSKHSTNYLSYINDLGDKENHVLSKCQEQYLTMNAKIVGKAAETLKRVTFEISENTSINFDRLLEFAHKKIHSS